MNVRAVARLIRRFGSRANYTWLSQTNPQLSRAFSIHTHMTIEERIQLYRLACSARCVLEIGSYLGASASCFGAAMRKHCDTGKVFCIDTWHNETMPEGMRDTYQEFIRNTAPYERYIVAVRGLSTEVVSAVKERTDRIDLLFIDGDHSYEAVKADWEAYKGLLGPKSVAVFHDCGWAEGVQRVIREDVMPLVDQFNRLPNMWWGSFK